jgi:hypothetical protein
VYCWHKSAISLVGQDNNSLDDNRIGNRIMLDVYLTVDVEIWCDGWNDIDQKFPAAFRKYVYGHTNKGSYGLPFQMQMLNEHGLHGVFFVEPLFAARFGMDPLEEIVGLVNSAGQETQLHLHTEWVDEAKEPLLPRCGGKRQHLRYFDHQEQTILIGHGKRMLRQAGAEQVSAFRAGSFAFNRDTLPACRANGILVDSSYNATMFGPDSGVASGQILEAPVEIDGMYEYPMTVFIDGRGTMRHAQLTACSYREIEGLLWQAVEQGRKTFVLLSHGFELLDMARNRADKVVIKRFEKLCALLDKHRDVFRTQGFNSGVHHVETDQPAQLHSSACLTAHRMLEQLYRRVPL